MNGPFTVVWSGGACAAIQDHEGRIVATCEVLNVSEEQAAENAETICAALNTCHYLLKTHEGMSQ